MRIRLLVLGSLLLANLILVGCTSNNEAEEPGSLFPTEETALPTDLVVSVTDASPSPSTPIDQIEISLVNIEPDDAEGAFGCGDKLLPIERQVDNQGSSELEAAIQALLATPQQVSTDEGITAYNALAQSNLTLERIDEDSTLNVYLSGNLSISGTCDAPRVQEQLLGTIRRHTDQDDIQVFVNDTSLDEVLSQR